MHAIIFADRNGDELMPLCNESCPALLPVANRPLLEYTMDDLASIGVTKVFIVVSKSAYEVKTYFGDGALWGMEFCYLLSRGEEDPEELMQRYSSLIHTPYLAMRGDVLRASACIPLLKKATTNSLPVVTTNFAEKIMDIMYIRDTDSSLQSLHWANNQDNCGLPDSDPDDNTYSSINSLQDYHQASLKIINHEITYRIDRKLNEDLSAGPRSNVSLINHITGNVTVGKNTNIHKHARLSGPTIIGDYCYIDRNARVENSIILPGSYIGEGLEIKNAIVSGKTLIRIDNNSCIQVNDPVLLSNIFNEFSFSKVALHERITALLMFLLSLPLWPLALLFSLNTKEGSTFTPKEIYSNRFISSNNGRKRQLITGRLFNTSIPLLRHLPLLWLVIKGDIRLFGATSLQYLDNNRESFFWETQHKFIMSGLLGPTELFLPADAPEEEICLNEVYFQQKLGLLTHLQRTFQASLLLFNVRTWLPSSLNQKGFKYAN